MSAGRFSSNRLGPRPSPPVVLAVGVFDGVHVGHRRLLGRAVRRARALGGEAWVLTFDRHPLRLLRPVAAPPMLMPLARRLRTLSATGVDGILVLRFDRRVALWTPEEFVRRLRRRFPSLCEVVVGTNWRFGRGGCGTPAFLQRLGAKDGIRVTLVPPCRRDGRLVSSTRIRRAVRRGDLDEAARLLGRPFSVEGRVGRGQALGRQLGFPTANLSVSQEVMPPDGVYAVWVRVDRDKRGNIAWYPGVLNLGRRPTLGRTLRRVLEVHLLEVRRHLYGREIEVAFIRRLRTERRFPNLEELRRQIGQDVRIARRVLWATGFRRPRPPLSSKGLSRP